MTHEQFLLDQLSQLQTDLTRYQHMLDGYRLGFARENQCSEAEAELRLLTDATWKILRRQQAAARRSWLQFQKELRFIQQAAEAAAAEEAPASAPSPEPCAGAIIETPCPMPPAPASAPQPHLRR